LYGRSSGLLAPVTHGTLTYIQEPLEIGKSGCMESHLTLSNLIFLPTAYSPALICFGRKRGWWITCNYPTVLKEKNRKTKRVQPALSVG
jgi:hypothetical protein